jgi:hypothetical protein
MGVFGAAVVRRYGPNGSFWTENPAVPKVPIRYYQIWNEPHMPASWPPKPDPAQYVALARAASVGIKGADPQAKIVSAGISDSLATGAIRMVPYIEGMYKAGGKDAFDVLGLHPYSETAEGSISLVEQARAVMAKYNDSDADVWVTEIGWASGGPPYRFVTDEAGQASRLRTLYTELARRRSELHVLGVVWHYWHDFPTPPDDWSHYTGLLRANGTAKPSLLAYRALATADSTVPAVTPPPVTVPPVTPPQVTPPPVTPPPGSGSGGNTGSPPNGTAAGSVKSPPGAQTTPIARGSVSFPAKLKLRALLRGLSVSVSCPTACRVTLTLTVPRAAARRWSGRLARVSRSLPAGTTKVLVKPSRRAAKRLRNVRRVQVFLSARATPSGGTPVLEVTRRISVKR